MRTATSVRILVALVVLCPATIVTARPDGEGIEFRTLAEGTSSGIVAATDRVITHTDEWAAVWAQIHEGRDAPPLPHIDFTQRMVVLTAMGVAPTHGFQIRIHDIRVRKDWAEIRIREVIPGRGCINPASATEPYHVIEMPLGTRITFRRSREIVHCR